MPKLPKQIPQTLLIVGDGAAAVESWMRALLPSAQREKKQHPDIHRFHPEGKSGLHPIESLKELQRTAALVPFEAPYKFFLIYEAERMLPTSGNALLKTLEEPAKQTLFILFTDHEREILPTIRSRCQTYRFAQKERSADPLEEKFYQTLCGARTQIKEIEKQIEEDQKKWEKELLLSLPDELTAAQKESYRKEIEGEIALRTQRRLFALFEQIVIWHRDRLAKELGSPHLLSERTLPFHPLSSVETTIQKARLALMRGVKLSTTLDYIYLALS